ncbi:(2Fe-2S)-binding protein [Desulfocarbo indianensis]|nr:(2Fe-2S)-binding protein [Desulfocarbo indianensis]
MKIPIEFVVNGEPQALFVKPNHTLLDVLRDDLGLLGAKKGCGEGKCGTCTVIMDGKPVNSCLILAPRADGSDIITVEGLADGEPHPMQKAFVEQGAVQCGFCTPGMIMTACALLDEKSDPSEEEIRLALSGNLCRCTGYAKIVEAVQVCAQRIQQDKGA